MVEGFEIKVPITLKGGQEGEKVGKQIGENIASQLKRNLKAINIGGTGGTGSDITGMLGVTKGLKGVTTKLGVVGAAIAASVGLLSKASPYLKGILKIFGRAFMIFFRPFGDFLATLLRPLAILMMKMAVAFLKWTRPISTKVRESVAEVPQIKRTGMILPDIGVGLANWALKVGAAFGTVIVEIGKSAFNLGTKIGEWLLKYVIIPAGEWLGTKLFGIWSWTKDFSKWLWEKITSIWSWGDNFPGWIWSKITNIWRWGYDFGYWIWGKITKIWSWGYNFGSWLWGRITSIWSWHYNIGSWLWNKITNALGHFSFGGFSSRGYATGTPFVPETGLYQLHRGEEVIPRTKVTQNKSTILNPTFNFNGNVTPEMDMDEIARRTSRVIEMELKQKGII